MYQAGAVITDDVQTLSPATHKQSTKLVLQLQTRYQAGGAAVTDNVPSTSQGGQKKLPERMFGTNLKIKAAWNWNY